MTEPEVYVLAVGALGDVLRRVRDDQWDMALPPSFARRDTKIVPTLREVVNYHAYNDAWVPDMLAGHWTTWTGSCTSRSATSRPASTSGRPTHEKNETAAQEAAENNGTRPGHGGHGHMGGPSNEDSTHEKGEDPAREAAEDARPSPAATP